jgi:hypothetical protein
LQLPQPVGDLRPTGLRGVTRTAHEKRFEAAFFFEELGIRLPIAMVFSKSVMPVPNLSSDSIVRLEK